METQDNNNYKWKKTNHNIKLENTKPKTLLFLCIQFYDQVIRFLVQSVCQPCT